jgi:choline dehydrogenase-like flavoprotein
VSGYADAGAIPEGALSADVCVVGSGAGGAVTAAQLAAAGLEVLVLEEGGHHTRTDFHMLEHEAYPMLYQEGGGRATADLGIGILQGRAVGGTTVVNWTTCFRTPDDVIEHWHKAHAVNGLTVADLRPHYEAVEQRLNIHKVGLDEANRNNLLLYEGCKALGLPVDTTARNVRGCFKSGYCGMGCPVDAKQSMLVTYLPDAVAKGARVVSRCRVDRLEVEAGKVARARCTVLGRDGYHPTGAQLTVRAARFVLSAGAINTPAILIRSGLGGGGVGRRTFLHPSVGLAGHWKDPIEPYFGAPQSVASHALAHPSSGMGMFLEAAPLHPMLASIAVGGFGAVHAGRMAELMYMTGHISLAIDGFDASEPGGTVTVRPSGAAVLDYPFTPRLAQAMREGLRTLARIDLAAGAEYVVSGHDPAVKIASERDIAQLDSAPYDVGRLAVFSAHQMGGAAMGDDPARAVVRSADLRHHSIANLYVIDGSVFPTGLGVNPQESIYGLAHLMADRLAQVSR